MNQYKFIPKWIPNKSFGSIVLGESILKYKEELNLTRMDGIGIGDGDQGASYTLEGFDISIDTEEGKVTGISVEDQCIYKGQNLIGMNIIDLANLLEVSDYDVGEGIIHEDGDIKTPMTFDDFGLQAWFSCNALVTVSIADYRED